jgi:alkylhydroperoxidase/carboxymuconolactone decarboxylase family protein YurZ
MPASKGPTANGLPKSDLQWTLIEMITHLAFYSDWPTANTALPIAQRIFDEAGK